MILIQAQLNTHLSTPFKLQPLHPSLARRYLTPRQQKGDFPGLWFTSGSCHFPSFGGGTMEEGPRVLRLRCPVVVTLKLFFRSGPALHVNQWMSIRHVRSMSWYLGRSACLYMVLSIAAHSEAKSARRRQLHEFTKPQRASVWRQSRKSKDNKAWTIK